MPYLPSALLIVLGLVVLVMALVRVVRSLRRFGAASATARAEFDDRSGLIKARVAALGVAIHERRRIDPTRPHGGGR